jgi:hypothetical protein
MSERALLLNPNRLLFIYCTYGWLATNFIAAQIPTQALFFVALRDSWVFIFIAILLSSRRRSDRILSASIFSLSLLGAVAFFEGAVQITDILIYFYGFRDLCLIALVFYVLSSEDRWVPSAYIYGFVYLVAGLFFLQVVSQLTGFGEQYRELFNLEGYYRAKGVSITLAGGFFGERPSLPLYSPGLIAELCAGFILLKNPFFGRWLLWALSVLTLSKVALYYLVLRLFRKVYLLMLVISVSLIPLIIGALELAKNNYPNSLISMHGNSVIEHMSPLQYITDEDFTFLPDQLGSSSIVAALLKGVNSSQAPESMLMARLLDYNYLSIFLLCLVIWMFFYLHKERRFLFVVFIGLQFLTGMANHPVGFLPIIYFVFVNSPKRARLLSD